MMRNERVLIYCNEKLFWLLPEEICCLQGNGSYTIITLRDGRSLKVSKNLKNVLALIPVTCTQFYRVQKSHVINVNFIEYIYTQSGYKNWVHLNNGIEIPMTVNARRELLELYTSPNNNNRKAQTETGHEPNLVIITPK